jgi:type II secretory pathway component PulC
LILMNLSLTKAAQIAAWVMVAVAIALGTRFALAFRRLPAAQEIQLPAPSLPTPAIAMPTAEEWEVFRLLEPMPEEPGSVADRFRLAGTFFLFGEDVDGAVERRLAIIDDLSERKQLIVAEEQEIAGYSVAHIEEDRVRLRRNGQVIDLVLSFSPLSVSGRPPTAQPADTPSMEDMPALENTRFGKRVGENRWVIRREELLRYYAELLDDPERIANVYASLKPTYEENSIAGYVLDPEGEEDFFRAVGLQEGDVIRRVNSMRMVSQRRAEYFISEFMKNRISAIVLDIERGDREEKLIYLIR